MKHLTTLHPKPPYRFDLLLDILSRFAHPSLEIVYQGAMWRALLLGDGMALIRVTSNGLSDSPVLEVHVAAQTGAVDGEVLLQEVKAILPHDLDKTAFYESARRDGTLWALVEPLLGLPQLRTASAFEALMQTVIEQQIAWVVAQKAQHWLVRWAGNGVEHDGMNFYAFPTPEQIANATIDDLTPLKITFKRMALMIDLSRQVVEGRLDLEGLRHQSPEAAYDYLLGIKGIGHWTAVVTLERAFGHLNHVAYNDVALQAAVNRFFYGGEGRIPAEQLKATFERYGQFGGMAAHYTLMRWVLAQYRVNGA